MAVARRWETLQVSLLLLVLLVIFFGKAIFTGQKLLPADIAYADPVYLGHAPTGFAQPHNILLYDQAYQFYPWRVYVSQALHQGFLPFWNPYIYCGAPLMAEDQPAVFYPLNILSYALSPPDAVLFMALARLFIAGLATYWFVRTISVGKFGALVSAITFTFSGFMIVWLGHPHTNVAAWLPALFLTLEWLYRRTSLRHMAFVSLVVAAQLTGGHGETALYTLSAGGIYYLFRVLTSDRARTPDTALDQAVLEESDLQACPVQLGSGISTAGITKVVTTNHSQAHTGTWRYGAVVRLLSFAAAAMLGFALAAIHLLPFLEWLQYSAELQWRTGEASLRMSRLGPKRWLAGMLPMVLPNIFNNPTWPGEYRSFFPSWNFVEQTLYIGIIGLSLALVAIFVRLLCMKRGGTVPRLNDGETVPRLNDGETVPRLNDGETVPRLNDGETVPRLNDGETVPRLNDGGTVPHLADGGTVHDRPVWFLAVMALVALGAALRLPVFDWLNHLPLFNIAAYGRLRLIYTFCMAVLAGFGASDISDRVAGGNALRAAMWFLTALALVGILVLWIAPGVLSSMVADIPGAAIRQLLQGAISRAFRISNVRMYWPVLIAVLGVLILGLYRRCRVMSQKNMRVFLVLLIAVDLFALGVGYHGTIQEEFVFPETPALHLLKSDGDIFRIVGTNIDFMPNTCMIYGLQDVRGLDFPTDRYRDFCQAIGGEDWLGYGILFTKRLQARLLGLLNTKYVLTSSRLSGEILQDMRFLAEDGDVRIYENLSWLPRAFIVHRVRVTEDGGDVLRILQDPDLNLGSEIVLERSPPPDFIQASREEGDGIQWDDSLQATTEITRYEPNHIGILAKTPAQGFLFLSDSYYPGWKAYVDGAETEIYQANYAFRAVYLPAGEHTIEFIYEPRSFRVASFTSLLALLAVAVLLVSRRSWGPGHSSEARRTPEVC